MSTTKESKLSKERRGILTLLTGLLILSVTGFSFEFKESQILLEGVLFAMLGMAKWLKHNLFWTEEEEDEEFKAIGIVGIGTILIVTHISTIYFVHLLGIAVFGLGFMNIVCSFSSVNPVPKTPAIIKMLAGISLIAAPDILEKFVVIPEFFKTVTIASSLSWVNLSVASFLTGIGFLGYCSYKQIENSMSTCPIKTHSETLVIGVLLILMTQVIDIRGNNFNVPIMEPLLSLEGMLFIGMIALIIALIIRLCSRKSHSPLITKETKERKHEFSKGLMLLATGVLVTITFKGGV